jgi:hypothetical protein
MKKAAMQPAAANTAKTPPMPPLIESDPVSWKHGASFDYASLRSG